jgi:endonuclease YncB( thermonuclease family)
VRVAIWLGQELRVLVRIRGVDAPEMRGRCPAEKARAEDAAAALRELVSEGTVLLTRIEGEKYFGRVLADVATPDGSDLAAALIAGGHARAYDGGARRSWCEIGSLRGGGGQRRARFAAE